ncbi:hypothetical protein C0995_002735 [Termitomyces sp. Mi166|nr:hypothetical protein C0995_002735 [Termitomyces sp. Mi166\
MTGKRWDASSVTTQLRLTSRKLGQLQERQDSQGAITRKDIATLLQQRKVSLARAKAQSLQREDALGDLLEVLEMYVGQLLEHFQELDQRQIDEKRILTGKDLEIVSQLLVQHLGLDFARSAVTNSDGHVAPIAIRTTTTLPLSAKDLDLALQRIASESGSTWTPEPLRQDILKLVSEILDTQTAPVLDLSNLRRLCRRDGFGREYGSEDRFHKNFHATELSERLLLGVLPAVKASWANEIESQRNSYYGLVQRLLDPLSALSPPDSASNLLDATLLKISRQLSTTPSNLFGNLAQAPSSFSSCPLDDDAKDEIKLHSAKNLDLRLDILRATNSERGSPSSGKSFSMVINTPEISLSSPDMSQGEGLDSSTTTLLVKPFATNTVHPKHFSALLRLLYLHTSINPGNISPHIASLLVPIYVVLNHEVIPDDLAHVEADTFWLFEAMVGELSELADTEGGRTWTKRLSDRLAWADSDLFSGLVNFSGYLQRNCKNDHKPTGLWSGEQILYPPLSPLHPWESRDAFMEGPHFLQRYPIEATGGIDGILQDAFDLVLRRDEETKLFQKETLSLGARIKATMWKGFTNQELSPDTSPEESEDEVDETSHEDNSSTETPNNAASGLTLRLTTTVWRGITNQTSMESSPSPNTPLSPSTSSTSSTSIINPMEHHRQDNFHPTLNIRVYADKIRDSDTMATIAKASSNWKAKSMLGSWGRSPASNGQGRSWFSQVGARREANREHSIGNDEADQPLSIERSGSCSPPGPKYSRPPPDSFILPHNKTQSPKVEEYVDGIIDKRFRSQPSLVALTRTSPSQATARSGPRPLLLSPSTLLTSPPIRPVSRSARSSPAPENSQWVDVMRLKGHSLHRDSMSSVSSLSPPDALRSTHSNRSGWDSDTGTSSRRIPLNRKSVSPMAPNSRRQGRSESPAASSDRGFLDPSPQLFDEIDLKSWTNAEADSASLTSQPSGVPSSTVIRGPRKNGEDVISKKLIGQIVPSTSQVNNTSDLSAAQAPSRSPRFRTKHHAPHPLDLNLENNPRPDMERKLSHPNRLTVEWPSDDHETPTTPRASSFEVDGRHRFTTHISSKSSHRLHKASAETQERPRKISTDHYETRMRKPSGQRPRKSSSDPRENTRREESSAEGDDEGYDDLLSAYESENS